MPVESLQTVHLRNDGSGALLHQLFFRPALGNVARVFEAFTGGRFPLRSIGEGWIRNSASNKGDGVEYIDHQPDRNEKGWQGYNIAYRFECIDYLKLDLTGIGAKLTQKSGAREVKIDTTVRFSLIEGELNIVMPFSDSRDGSAVEGALFGAVWGNGKAVSSWISKWLGGFRSGTAVTFENGYRWTNAKHAAPGSIVLVDFAMEPVLNSPDFSATISRLAKAKSLRAIDAAIGDLRGIKIEPRPVVRVEL